MEAFWSDSAMGGPAALGEAGLDRFHFTQGRGESGGNLRVAAVGIRGATRDRQAIGVSRGRCIRAARSRNAWR